MARRPPPSKPERPFHNTAQKRQDIERLSRRIKELEEFDPESVTKRFKDPKVTAIEMAIDETLASVFGHGTVEYDRYKAARRLDHGPLVLNTTPDWLAVRSGGGYGRRDETSEARQFIAEGKEQALAHLRQAVKGLEEEIGDQEALAGVQDGIDVTWSADATIAGINSSNGKVFVVHGHDEAVLQAVARFLEQIELQAIILREQPDQGRSTIEKFEHHASQVGFAVVLLTPDDIAGSSTVPTSAMRARQNVIFELGYFAGKLGRGRACLVRKGDVEIPSDLYGVIYTDFDAAGGWKIKLVQELKAAGLEFDANKVWQ